MSGKKGLTRKERALAAQRERECKQRLRLGGIALAAIVVLGGLFWLANRPQVPGGEVVAGADGTAWGPADAPVVIEEWSDFN